MRTRILLVDPDPKFGLLARLAIEKGLGALFEVAVCRGAEEAFAAAGRARPAVAVVASDLAGLDPFDLARSLARGRQCVVVLVAEGDEGLATAFLEAGACAILPKPVAPPSLASLVAEIAARGPEVRDGRPFVALVGPPESAVLRAQVERAARMEVVSVQDAEVAIALARSPRCRAVVAVEPIRGFTPQAIHEYLRSEQVRVPVVRVGAGDSRHPQVPSLAPRCDPAELAACLARVLPAGDIAAAPAPAAERRMAA